MNVFLLQHLHPKSQLLWLSSLALIGARMGELFAKVSALGYRATQAAIFLGVAAALAQYVKVL